MFSARTVYQVCILGPGQKGSFGAMGDNGLADLG